MGCATDISSLMKKTLVTYDKKRFNWPKIEREDEATYPDCMFVCLLFEAFNNGRFYKNTNGNDLINLNLVRSDEGNFSCRSQCWFHVWAVWSIYMRGKLECFHLCIQMSMLMCRLLPLNQNTMRIA